MLCHLFHAFVYLCLHLSSPCFCLSFPCMPACCYSILSLLCQEIDEETCIHFDMDEAQVTKIFHDNSHLEMSTTHNLRKLSTQKSFTLTKCEESSDQKTSPPVNKKWLMYYPFMMIHSHKDCGCDSC